METWDSSLVLNTHSSSASLRNFSNFCAYYSIKLTLAHAINYLQQDHKTAEAGKEQRVRIAIHHYHCDHLGAPIALTDSRQARWPGLPSWTPGAMCCRNTTRKASTRRSGTMTGRRGCITTGIGITIRWWGLY